MKPVSDSDKKVKKDSQDELSQEYANTSQLFTPHVNKQLFTHHANNVSAEYILFMELITSYDNYNNNSKEEEERREGIFTSLVNIVGSPISRKIVLYLLKQGAVTQPELIENIPTTGATVSRTLNTLRICGIVEKRGSVGNPYRVNTDRGAGIPIWILKYVGPEASIEAQKRYGELVKKGREYIRQEEQRAESRIEAEAAFKQKMLEDDLRRVLEIIKPPIDRMSPIYDAFNKLEIKDPESRSYIKKYYEDETVKIKLVLMKKEGA